MNGSSSSKIAGGAILLSLVVGCGRGADPAPVTVDPPAPIGPPAKPEWIVTHDGVGPVRIGATVAELNLALRDSLRPTYEINDECDYVHPAALPPGIAIMVEKDTVVRVDVDSAGIRTAEGAGVGDTEAETLARYAGRVVVEPHKYTGPEGHYLVVRPGADSGVRLIFETDGRRVERYRAGRRPAVEYVEGCA